MRVDPRYVLPLVALALGAIAAILIVKSAPTPAGEPAQEVAPLVRTMPAEVVTLRHRVRTHGTVAPRTQSDLTAEVSGRVTWVSPNLVSGGFFARGEPLLRIDEHDYEVALERARAALTRSESQLRLTVKELARQRRLAGQSVASEANLDAAVNAERAADAGLRDARATLSQAERDLERTEIAAPYDGRVREEAVDVGQWVNRGSPIAKLYAVDYAEVRLPVPDGELAFLDIPLTSSRDFGASVDEDPYGQMLPDVVLHAEFAGEPRQWQGRIVRTEGEIDTMTRMMYVVARVDDPYLRNTPPEAAGVVPLAVGLFVEAEISGREAREVIVLPRQALREGNRVFVVDDEQRLRFRDVEVIRRQGDSVVIGAGLAGGDLVCTSPVSAAIDGMRVRLSSEESAREPSAESAS